jgi:hypothetical protein
MLVRAAKGYCAVPLTPIELSDILSKMGLTPWACCRQRRRLLLTGLPVFMVKGTAHTTLGALITTLYRHTPFFPKPACRAHQD